MKKKTYESVTRTAGSFEKAWKGIDLLLKKKIPFVVKYALLPQNQDDRDFFESWASSIPWMKKPPRYSIFFDLRYRRDDLKKNELIKNLRPAPKEGLSPFLQKSRKFKNEMESFCSRFMYPSGDKIFSCGSGMGSGCVDPYGFFSPCLLLKDPDTQFDLKKGSLKEALLNFFPKIREMKTYNPEYLDRCARCFLKGMCNQCPARSWIEHGTLDTPIEYHCQIAHLQAIYLGLLEEGEKASEVKDWKKRIQKFVGKDVFKKNNR